MTTFRFAHDMDPSDVPGLLTALEQVNTPLSKALAKNIRVQHELFQIDQKYLEAEKSRRKGQVSLGELIDILQGLCKDAPPRIPVFARYPDGTLHGLESLASYRGFYEDLAFQPCSHRLERSLDSILAALKKADGSTFNGYKGGDFVMSKDTPMWVSRYGDASNIMITGAVLEESQVVLTTDFRGE